MAVRPNFQDPVEMTGADMTVAGTSDDDPLPVGIQVLLEQNGRVAAGSVDEPGTAWRTTLPSEGFSAGSALAFGVEIRTGPLQAITWSQVVTLQ